MGGLKLNVGCGLDYREGFVNIDANPALRVDHVLTLPEHSLLSIIEPSSAKLIVANDFIEHHTHWKATQILRQFLECLHPDGTIQMKLPDFDAILTSGYTSERKIEMLFGGQDKPQGQYDEFRKSSPELFTHGYAYTRRSMKQELESIGFRGVVTEPDGNNFMVFASK